MKIYSPVKEASKDIQAEILNELRSISERQGAGLRRDSFLSLTNDREDRFFLKSAHSFILWGKVYFEPFTAEKAEKLKQEQDELSRKFLQPLKLQVFFSEGEISPSHAEAYPEADYFQYSMIQSSSEKAMIVDRIPFSKPAQPILPAMTSSEGRKSLDYSFSKQSQLTRNELAELIDLSLELKRF